MKACISVFGSGKVPPSSPDYKTAGELGRLLARAGFTHVSGGYGGTMEAGARGAIEAGGGTVGVTVEGWGEPNPSVSRAIVMPDLFARIRKLMELGEGYVVLPGATGTLIELAMAWECANKGLDAVKPIVILGDFWIPVIHVIRSRMPFHRQKQPFDRRRLFANYLWRVETPLEAVELLNERLGRTFLK